MRGVLVAIAVSAAILPFPVQAQSLEDIIGSWTRLRAIGLYCPKFYRVDIQYLEKLQSVFEDTGGAMFPGQVTEARIRQAGARRDAEVRAAGAKQWCSKWRKSMRADGTGEVWP